MTETVRKFVHEINSTTCCELHRETIWVIKHNLSTVNVLVTVYTSTGELVPCIGYWLLGPNAVGVNLSDYYHGGQIISTHRRWGPFRLRRLRPRVIDTGPSWPIDNVLKVVIVA